MEGLETVDALGVGARVAHSPGRKLERQIAMKERQFSLKWLGRSPPTTDEDENTPDSIPSGQANKRPEKDRDHPRREQGSGRPVKLSVSVRTRQKQRTSREARAGGSLAEAGRRISEQRSAEDEEANRATLHELFKKSFITSLAAKAMQRPGYLPGNGDFDKPVEFQGKPFRRTEKLLQAQKSTGSPKRDPLERAVRSIESSRTSHRSPPNDRRGLPPTHEKFSEQTNWVSSKRENLNLGHHKQAWSSSKDIEETSKDFILTKFFQTPTKSRPPKYTYDMLVTNEEASPSMYSAIKRSLSAKRNGSEPQEGDDVRTQLLNEVPRQVFGKNAGRGDRESSESDKTLHDHSAQIRRDVLGNSSRSLQGSRNLDSVTTTSSTTSIGSKGVRAKDMLSRDQVKSNASTMPQTEENQNVMKVEAKLPGMQKLKFDLTNESSKSESQQVLEGREELLRSLKMAAAVDHTDFIRVLRDNGVVQSTAPIRNDIEQARLSANSKFTLPARPSSPSATRRSSPRDAQGNHVVDGRSPSAARRNGPREVLGNAVGDGRGVFQREADRSCEARLAESGKDSPNLASPLVVRRRRSISIDGLLITEHVQKGEIQKQLSRLSSAGSSQSCESSEFSRQSSYGTSRTSSTVSDDSESSLLGGSIIRTLMKKASLRNSLPPNQPAPGNYTPQSSAHSLPSTDSAERGTGARRTLSFTHSSPHVVVDSPESTRRIRASSASRSPTLGRQRSSPDHPKILVQEQSGSLDDSTLVIPPVSEQVETLPAAAEQNSPGNNPVRVHVRALQAPAASDKLCSPVPPIATPQQPQAHVKSCPPPIATAETTLSPGLSGGGSWSPGGDDSGSDASGIEQPSPVSVLSYKGRTPFQSEENRLSPLEHKLQELHERIDKSRTDVRNQKKANLAKIKAAAIAEDLNVKVPEVIELKTEEPFSVVEDANKPQVQIVARSKEVLESKPSAVASEENVKEAAGLASGPLPDFCTTLETFDLRSVASWSEEQQWDLVYVRDVLVASGFGRDKSVMTKWHSAVDPIHPFLFEQLEDFYKNGTKFPGSQFLSNLALCQENHVRMQEHIRTASTHRGTIEAMNRCHLFDVVNETLSQRLAPYVARGPGPGGCTMASLAELMVRPRPTGNLLFQEIWSEIWDQIGDNGSMAMDKDELHRSLEDLISKELYSRTRLFPSQELERAAERIGLELEHRIFQDLLQETIVTVFL